MTPEPWLCLTHRTSLQEARLGLRDMQEWTSEGFWGLHGLQGPRVRAPEQENLESQGQEST